jgi:hypothetical protein
MQLRKIRALRGVFGEINGENWIISMFLLSHRSPNLNPCDSYLWRKLRSVVYAKNPHALEALKENIRELQQVSRNFGRIQTCLTEVQSSASVMPRLTSSDGFLISGVTGCFGDRFSSRTWEWERSVPLATDEITIGISFDRNRHSIYFKFLTVNYTEAHTRVSL